MSDFALKPVSAKPLVDSSGLSEAERAAGPCAGVPASAYALPEQRSVTIIKPKPNPTIALLTPGTGSASKIDTDGSGARKYLFQEEGARVVHGLHLADPTLDAAALTEARDQWIGRNVDRVLRRKTGEGDSVGRLSWRTMMLAVARENVPGDPLLPLARRTVTELTAEFAKSGYTQEAAEAQVDRLAESFSRTSRDWKAQAALLRAESYYTSVQQ